MVQGDGLARGPGAGCSRGRSHSAGSGPPCLETHSRAYRREGVWTCCGSFQAIARTCLNKWQHASRGSVQGLVQGLRRTVVPEVVREAIEGQVQG
eukprot:253036-Hanusia_phi.AAC.3